LLKKGVAEKRLPLARPFLRPTKRALTAITPA
jgi:hypothetical protein